MGFRNSGSPCFPAIQKSGQVMLIFTVSKFTFRLDNHRLWIVQYSPIIMLLPSGRDRSRSESRVLKS